MKTIKRIFTAILTITIMSVGIESKAQEQDEAIRDSLLQQKLESYVQILTTYEKEKDSILVNLNSCESEKTLLEEQIRELQQAIEKQEQESNFNKEKESLVIESKDKEIGFLRNNLHEKEQILNKEKETVRKLTAEKEEYIKLADSLTKSLNEAEKKIIRTNEELKYTQQRAREAEAKINAATAKKKKVVAIQGIALKTFRTPNWSIAPDKITDGSIVYRIVNKNGGNVEFDYTAGASVMLWDLTKKIKGTETDTVSQKLIDLKKFDQEFSYSLGLYVGFGGSNLFKNFYVGPSFKFLDFFHLTAGINICEYEMLTGNFKEGDILPTGLSLTDQISKVWKPKPFVSLSFDLDFISYIKK